MAVFLSAMGITFAPVADEAGAYASGTQDGSPDAYGYTYVDSKEPAPMILPNWVARDPTATEVWFPGPPVDDFLYGPFTLFNFMYTHYGVPSDTFYVSDNGFITFNSTSIPFSPAWLDHPRPTSPNDYISCFGDALNPVPPTGGGSIYWWEDILQSRAVITWENVTRVADSTPQTFQLVLDGTADTATCQYLNVTTKGGLLPPLVAIENDYGEIGLQYHEFLEDGLAVSFVPPAVAPSDVLTVTISDRAPLQGEHDDYDSVMLQLNMTASSGSVGVFSITVDLVGTIMPGDVPTVTLWRDRDLDGFPSHWVDKPLAWGTPGAGMTVTLEPTASFNDPVLVTAGADVSLLITFDVSPAPSGLVSVRAVIPANGITLVRSTPDTLLAPLPFSSSPMDLVPMVADTLNVLPLDLAGPGGVVTQGEGSLPLLGLTLNVTGTPPVHDVEITSIRVALVGTSSAADIPTAHLYRDLDGNRVLDPAVDPMVGTASFVPGPPDFATFSLLPDTPPYLGVYPGQNVSLIVAVDIDYAATVGTDVGLGISMAGGDIVVRDPADVFVMPGLDPFETARVVIGPFVMPLVISPPVATIPTIDGTISGGEWIDGIPIPLDLVRGNRVPGIVYVKNDAMMLYVGIDAIGDESRRAFDIAGLMFDAPHNLTFDDGADPQFTIGGMLNQPKLTAHSVYNATTASWEIEDSPFDQSLPGHLGLEGAAGFGSAGPFLALHRMYEFAIPLTLLGAAPGDTVGLAVYSTFPDVLDGDPETFMAMDERTWVYSAWPLHYRGLLPTPTPDVWGEVCLSPCAPNTPPRLANGTIKTEIVSMDLTGQSEPVDYSVEYSDADNDPPRSPYVWVNYSNGTAVSGSPFNMNFRNWLGLPNDYTAGAAYNITLTLPACDLYTYAFNASDGLANVFTPPRSGPLVNCQPALTNGTVNPSAGNPGVTGFNYTVEYRDPDGNQTMNGTEFVYVNKSGVPVIGSPFPLSFGGWLGTPLNYTDGVLWYFNTTLAFCGGDYTFAFNMSDDLGYEAWFPDAQGPVVSCANTPPELLNATVNPTVGWESWSYIYIVTYRDADNDPYVNPRVWINESGTPIPGSPFPLMFGNWLGGVGDYSAGLTLFFGKGLPCGGNYTFVFNASDGQAVNFSATSPGPSVNCAPYLNWTGETGWMIDGVEPDSAPLGSSFQWRVDYFDADNEAPAANYPSVALFYGPTEWLNISMWEVNPADTDYTDGKRYAFVTNLVNPGTNYTYCFLANDSFGQSASPLCAAGPNVTATNLPPEVINGQVTPPSQTGATFDFEYNVTYRDPEGQPPAYVWTWVNESGAPIPGSPFYMGLVAFLGVPGNYTTGAVFNTTVTLGCGGAYSFSFQGSDGWNDAFSATSAGPTLSCPPNKPPVLSTPQVSPLTGDTNTVFNYSVVYSDADNDPPLGTPWVTINESGVPVVSQATVLGYWLGTPSDFVTGAVYNFSTTLVTPSIAYAFVFNATDGIDMVYSAETDAPDVVAGADTLTMTSTDVAPAVVNQGAVNVEMMVLNLSASPGDVIVAAMNITVTGTASDTDVAIVALYDDLDFSGTLSGGDSLLGQSPVVAGVAVITGLGLTVPGGGSKDVLVVYDVASGATPDVTMGARLASAADVVVQPPDSVNAFAQLDSGVAVVNAPPSAANLTVQGYSGGAGPAHITDHTPVLGWTYNDPNLGDAQSEFNVSVRESASGTVLWYLNTTGGQNSATYPGAAPALLDGVDYVLRVSVRDSLAGLWSSPFVDLGFHMNSLPPPPTEPAAPHNVTIPASASQTVSWAPGGFDPDGDTPLTYYWQVSENDPAFGTILAEGTATSTASGPFATVPGADYYWRVNVTDGWEFTAYGPAWRGYWNFSTSGMVNAAPSLVFTGETNYVGDGLDPETGFVDTTFTYRVRYMDADNDAPMGGAPNVVILKGGVETVNATMTFDFWVGVVSEYVTGAIYTFGTTLAAVGTDYTYRFYASDVNGAVAGGGATVETAGPVVGNRPPALDWTGETNYVTDGADPDAGDLSTTFAFRISYSDPDDHAPGEVRLVVAQGGSEVLNLSMGESDPLDTTYADGKTYNVTLPAGTLSIGSYEYHFYAVDVIGMMAAGAGTSATTLDVGNRPPALDWTQEPNYVSDGLHPETGDPATVFVFRISYSDPDNHSPGEVRLVITQGGSEILNASMAEVDPSDTDYADGKLYSSSTSLGAGTDYGYHFYAEDALGASAATAPVDAPDVIAPPGAITIVVLDEDGNGVGGATVTLTLSGQTYTPTPGVAGNYTFQDLPPGAYTLEVSKSGFQTPDPSSITIASGDNDPITVTLQTGGPPPVNLADYWWVLLILAILVILALLLLGRRRKPSEEEGVPGEEDLETEVAEELEGPGEAEERLEEGPDGEDGGGGEEKSHHDSAMPAIRNVK